MNPQRVAAEFGSHAALAREGIAAFYQALSSPEYAGIASAQARWESLFSQATGCDPAAASLKLVKRAAHYGVIGGVASPPALLFALQTWYALVVKSLTADVLRRTQEGGATSDIPGNTRSQDCRVGRVERAPPGNAPRIGGARSTRPTLQTPDPAADPLDWFLDVCSEPIGRVVRQLTTHLAEHDDLGVPQSAGDLFKPLYEDLFPQSLRHALGEYYTPDWLAEHVLDQVGYHGQPDMRLLDPACGSGTFLLLAIRRLRAAWTKDPHSLLRTILKNICGMDLNPLAAITARANVLIAIADLLPGGEPASIPVRACDSILVEPAIAAAIGRFDFVVGNPPWIAWDNLPGDYRRATQSLWEQYGLFSLSGNEARHGGGKKDLSMLMAYVSADRYLVDGGRLGMVITQTLFQTKGAGDGFRRFRLGADGPPLAVLRVDDLVAVRPFGTASNWTSTLVLQKGTATRYPVRYVKWSRAAAGRFTQAICHARPIDAARPGSPWLVSPEGWPNDVIERVGPSDYTAYLGANSGGANGVYWLDVLAQAAGGVRVRNLPARGKGGGEAVETTIEPDLLYPLVCWRDVARWCARPSAHLLLAQDAETRHGLDLGRMRAQYPLTLAYLQRFETFLLSRAAYRRYQGPQRAFYSMYNVGPYTLAPVKVIWRRMDRLIRAAVVGCVDDPLVGRRPVIPQETCVLVPCPSEDEAHCLCALLNSSLVNFLVAAHSVQGGKGFGTPSILEFLNLRRFCPDNARHQELAALSRQAHHLAGSDAARSNAGTAGVTPEGALIRIQDEIDRLAARLAGLSGSELAAIKALP